MNDDVAGVIPLFPLHAVLFPGGPLPLRIFETRYTDMVRRCMREQSVFGVLLIQEGEEAGDVASTATIGCSARITDFYPMSDGLLGITCVGERKFEVLRVWRESDGLNQSEIAWLPPEPAIELPERFEHLREAVARALEELGGAYQQVEKDFADSAWIGARLTELLPLPLTVKQEMLEIDDPLLRLDRLLEVVPTISRD